MICRNCGAEVPDNEMFCPSCGTRMIPDNNFGNYGVSQNKPFSFLNYKWFAPVAMVASNTVSSIVSSIIAFVFARMIVRLGTSLYIVASAVITIIIDAIVCAVMYFIITSKFGKEQKKPFRMLAAIPFLLCTANTVLGMAIRQIPSLFYWLNVSTVKIVELLFSGISILLETALIFVSYFVALRYLRSKESEINSDNGQF